MIELFGLECVLYKLDSSVCLCLAIQMMVPELVTEAFRKIRVVIFVFKATTSNKLLVIANHAIKPYLFKVILFFANQPLSHARDQIERFTDTKSECNEQMLRDQDG